MSDGEEKVDFRILDQDGPAAPGWRTLVADRGAVRFDYPRRWIVRGDAEGVKLYDRKPPRDGCVLAVSYRRIPPIDWTGLPLSRLVIEATRGDGRKMEAWGEVVEIRRIDLEIAWREGRYIDSNENRPALTRLCLGRRRRVQSLLTMDFREEHAKRFSRVWNIVLDSLQLDEPIEESLRGARF
ncbi:hypothetical protein EHM82_01535 [bacterium]|nr:MAG: hypothetical protein EHM82_01535 [bacterium]